MKRILVILVLLLVGFSVNTKAEEKPPIKMLLDDSSFYHIETEECAGLAKFLEYKRNSEERKKYFDRKYFLDIHDYLLTLIYFDMFDNFNYSTFSSFRIEDKFEEYDKVQHTFNKFNDFSVNDEEYLVLINVFLEKCIPVLVKNSEDTLDALSDFKRKSIRRLTHLPSSN